MADVRSMLRLEREKRKITHPHASYTTDGKLLCNLCEVLVKTENAWQGHLHSSQHALRLSRLRDAAVNREKETESKKRKASNLDSPVREERKKARAATPSTPSTPPDTPPRQAQARPEVQAELSEAIDGAPAPAVVQADTEEVDPAQLAAFDRQLAEMEAAMHASAAQTTAPTISAAPMTAAEVAAQAREEQSTQRGKREAELEAEKEDAARLLEDEFEEMETLEGRVKRLRERREALRGQAISKVDNKSLEVRGNSDNEQPLNEALVESNNEDEEDEESDDGWNFGAS